MQKDNICIRFLLGSCKDDRCARMHTYTSNDRNSCAFDSQGYPCFNMKCQRSHTMSDNEHLKKWNQKKYVKYLTKNGVANHLNTISKPTDDPQYAKNDNRSQQSKPPDDKRTDVKWTDGNRFDNVQSLKSSKRHEPGFLTSVPERLGPQKKF